MMTPVALITGRREGRKSASARPRTDSTSWSSVGAGRPAAPAGGAGSGPRARELSATPPPCDALDGPVVKAARRALEARDVNLVLPYVHKAGEAEIVKAFEKVIGIRESYPAAREGADLHFFETVVRVHRTGEGAPYTGLKPAGLDVGPAIPAAERGSEAGAAG